MNEETEARSEGAFTILDLAVLIAENLRLLIGLPLVAGLVALGITFAIPPTYTAATRILPPQQQQSAAAALLASQLGPFASTAGAALGIKNPNDLYVGMIKSRTVADGLIVRFNLRDVYDLKYDQDARKELADRTRVTAGRDGLILIEVEDEDPLRAAAIANGYVETLRDLTHKLAVTEAAQRRLFFEDQLKQARDELTRSEIALRGSGISEAALKSMPQSALEALARLKAQVTAQEVKLGAMRGFMTDTNPQYRQAQQELAALQAELAKAERMDASKATGSGADYVTKFRDFKYHETLFELMAKQFEMARLDEAREGAVVQVVDVAVPPERKSAPKRVLISLLIASLTLTLTFIAIFVRRAILDARSVPQYSAKLRRLVESLRLG